MRPLPVRQSNNCLQLTATLPVKKPDERKR